MRQFVPNRSINHLIALSQVAKESNCDAAPRALDFTVD